MGEGKMVAILEVERALHLNLNLRDHCESAGTQCGINLYLDQGDGYIVTADQLRDIAGKLIAAADEWDAVA